MKLHGKICETLIENCTIEGKSPLMIRVPQLNDISDFAFCH